MLVMKIAAGNGAIKQDGVGDIHVAMLASGQYRVYVNGGTLPDGEEDSHFESLSAACNFAFITAESIVEEFVAESSGY